MQAQAPPRRRRQRWRRVDDDTEPAEPARTEQPAQAPRAVHASNWYWLGHAAAPAVAAQAPLLQAVPAAAATTTTTASTARADGDRHRFDADHHVRACDHDVGSSGAAGARPGPRATGRQLDSGRRRHLQRRLAAVIGVDALAPALALGARHRPAAVAPAPRVGLGVAVRA